MALLSFSTTLSPQSLLPSFRRLSPGPSLRLRSSAAGSNGAALHAVSSSKKSKSRSSDSALVHALDAELVADADDVSSSLPVPDNFPFAISDAPGKTVITLTRTYKSEEISVVVSLPEEESSFGDLGENGEGGEEDEEDEDEEQEDDDEAGDIEDLDDGADELSSPSIVMSVTVSKASGKRQLEFVCRGYEDKVEIEGVRVREGGDEAGEEDDEDDYEGPYFEELEDNLKKAFRKYLSARGITPENTRFLMDYMGLKEEKEYRLWLRRVKEFIKS